MSNLSQLEPKKNRKTMTHGQQYTKKGGRDRDVKNVEMEEALGHKMLPSQTSNVHSNPTEV